MKKVLGVIFIFTTIFILSCDDNCKCDECGSDEAAVSDTDVTDDSSDLNNVEQDVVTEEEPDVNDEDVAVEEDVDTSSDEDTDDSDDVCPVITLGELWVDAYSDGMDYTGEPGVSLGDTDMSDWIQMMFSVEEDEEATEEVLADLTVGIYDLSTEANQDLNTCTECILIFEDFDEESEDEMGGPAKTYFQESGTIEITEIKEGTGQSKGIINAKLVQVYLDMFSMSVIKVEGGSCLEFKNEPFDTFCTPDCTDKICGSDGCYDTCGDCESGFECNEEGTSCDLIPTDDDVSDADTDA